MFVASEAEIASDTIHRHYCHANQHQYVAPSIWESCALNFHFWLSLPCHCCRHHFPMPKPTTTAVILILIATTKAVESAAASNAKPLLVWSESALSWMKKLRQPVGHRVQQGRVLGPSPPWSYPLDFGTLLGSYNG